MQDSTACFLGWHKSLGTISIRFENAPEIFTVTLWYYENTENSEGLPHIITLRNSSQNLVYSSSDVSGNSEPRETSRNIAIDPHFVVTTSLNMTFDLTSGDIKEFCLRGVDFFTCRKLSQCVHVCMPASFPQTLQLREPSCRFQLIAHQATIATATLIALNGYSIIIIISDLHSTLSFRVSSNYS